MRITALETLTLKAAITVHAGAISWLWVRLHTDAGVIGLGETYPAAAAAEAAVHESLAPVLLGQDARDITRLWQRMFQAVSYHGWAGAEMRAISAVDLALWDLAGKAAGLPVYRLLGGRTRERVRTYNTCYQQDYNDVIVAPQAVREGAFDPPDGPGLGVELAPALLARSDVHAKRSTL